MPAPDFETIFNPEDAIEAAAKTVLRTFGIEAFMQREVENLPNTRVDIQCLANAHREHRGFLPNGKAVRDAWNGSLVFSIWTPRFIQDGEGNVQPADPGMHGRYRGKLRHAIEYFAERFNADVLPYHVLTNITQSGTDPQTAVDDAIDVSAVHFDIVISVRSGAWPAAAD